MQVLVIGGGITGLGIARDLSLRGLDVKLIDRGEVCGETSTHFHGELHSGGRYAVKDPGAAKKCIQESRILKDIAEDYVRQTGGLFLKLEEDSEDYYQKKKEQCKKCDIPVEEVSGEEIRKEIPELSGNIDKALRCPDGVIKPIEFISAMMRDIEDHGAEIIENTAVKDIEVNDGQVQKVITDRNEFEPDLVVNSTGPWAAKTADLADLDIDMKPTKGVMTEVENPGIDTVLNRCAPVADGDIVIPTEDKVILGTTSIEVEDPDDYPKEQFEEDKMIQQGSKMVPKVEEKEVINSYWGLRPLYDPSASDRKERDVTREFSLIDHEERTGIKGIVTVVGGKWTTHRFMAEKTSNLVCEKLGIDEECVTDETELPPIEEVEIRKDSWPPQ